MFTSSLARLYSYNLKIPTYFGLIRDFLLISIIIGIFIVLISKALRNKKLFLVIFELVLIITFAILITQAIKNFYPAIRPYSYFYPLTQEFNSFPSQHMVLTVALATAIFRLFPDWGILLFLLSVLIGILSWLSLAHWPLDIIVGAFLGFIISTFILDFIKYLFLFLRKIRK